MSKSLPDSTAYEILKRIENASSKTELEAIKKILQEYDEDQPKVKELVLALKRR